MKNKLKIFLLIFITGLIFFILFIIWGFYPSLPKFNYNMQMNGSFTTVSLEELRELTQKQLQYSLDNPPRLYKVDDKEKIEVLKEVAKTATYSQLSIIPNLAEYYAIGYYPGIPLSSPRDLNYIQYGVGISGWSWYIGYDPKTQIQIFVSIGRTTVGSPSMIGNLGNSPKYSYYNVSAHIGIKDNIISTNASGPGIYIRDGQSNPRYKLIFNSKIDNLSANIIWQDKDKFNINVSWTKSTTESYKIDVIFDSSNPPSFNYKDGCACTGGTGTPYYSYTSPTVQGNITFKNNNYNMNSRGWIDRQMGGMISQKGFFFGLWTMLMKGKIGLGPYLWNNLHFKDKQYMVFSLLKEYPKLNDIVDMYCIKYENSKPTYDIKGKAKILKNKNNIPIKYQLTIDNEQTVFMELIGLPIFNDDSGNPHSAGVATLSDINGNSLGWSFMEASNMDDSNTIKKNALNSAGIPEKYHYLWNKKSNWNTFLLIFSLIIGILSFIAIIVGIVGVSVTYFKNDKKKSYKKRTSKKKSYKKKKN
jgi:hypothetical protein